MEADIIYKALAKVTLNNPLECIFVHCVCSKINPKPEQRGKRNAKTEEPVS
jgi:hypothetical protein